MAPVCGQEVGNPHRRLARMCSKSACEWDQAGNVPIRFNLGGQKDRRVRPLLGRRLEPTHRRPDEGEISERNQLHRHSCSQSRLRLFSSAFPACQN